MGATSRRGFERDVAGVRPRRARSRRSPLVGWLAAVSAASLLMVPGVTWADEAPQPTEPVATSTGSEGLDVLAGDPADTTSAPTETTPTPTGTTPTASDSTTPASTGSVSPTADPSTSPSVIGTDAGATSPQARTAGASPQSGGDIMPLAVGTPDGGTAPYVYWDVKDQNGNLVSGATFKFEARINSGTTQRPNWEWNTGSNAGTLSDCNGTCSTNTGGNSLDRDSDGGEFLLEHRGTARDNDRSIVSGNNYRVSQVTAPAGYEWVVSGSNTKTIGKSNSNSVTWNEDNGESTHRFDTFPVKKINFVPSCEAGFIYGISSAGQIQQVAPGAVTGNVTTLGSTPSTKSDFNGIGIGYGGNPVYAYARGGSGNSTSNVEIFKYDTNTGIWTSTGVNVDSTKNNGTAITFVAGGVNLDNGRFYLGGYTSAGSNRVFRLWEFNPATNEETYKGSIATPTGNFDAANGDLAFNANGDLFVVRGTEATTTVYSVTAANLAVASGGTIAASPSKTVSGTSSNVNGVAFDSDGKGYLGSGSIIESYSTPGWTDQATHTTSLTNSTDLAGCGSPPTIVIEKEIIGGRVNPGDQFKLTLSQGLTLLGEATTSGPAVGLQNARIGPLPTVRNVALNFAEVASGTTNLNNYASAFQCTVTHRNGTVVNLDQVNGISGTVTIPSTGEAVRCVFRNSPLIANVKVHKTVTDVDGLNPTPGQGWMVGAAVTATTGTVTTTPAGATQTTNASGDASWSVKFNAVTSRATVSISETQQPGYAFATGSCTITHLNGSTTTTTLTSEAATDVTGVVPGDQVDCTYTNKQKAGSVTWNKVDDQTPAAPLGGSEWTITGPGAPAPGIVVTDCVVTAPATCPTGAFKDQDPAAGKFRLDGLAWGTYTVHESTVPSGYEGAADFTITIDGSHLSIAHGNVVNTRKLGEVTWTKVTKGTTDKLAGSEWKITGPSPATTELIVTDCMAANATLCTGADKDPVAGQFLVKGLAWGDYTLVETKAPPGYVLDGTVRNITLSAGSLSVGLGDIENYRPTGPVLPLTGGLGRDHVYSAGALVLLLATAAYGAKRYQGRNNPRSA